MVRVSTSGPSACHRHVMTIASNNLFSSFLCFGFFNYKVLLVGLIVSGESKRGVGCVGHLSLENFKLRRMIDVVAKNRVN